MSVRLFWKNQDLLRVQLPLWSHNFQYKIHKYHNSVGFQFLTDAPGKRFNSTKREPKKSWDDKLVVLSKILEHPPEAVGALLNRGKSLLAGNEESMAKTWKVLQTHGFGIGALNEYPKLLLETPASVENYILIMKESGFHTIRPHMIMKFREMSGRSIVALKRTSFISEKTDVLANYFKVLGMPPDLEEKTRKALDMYDGNHSLVEMRMFLLIHYLAYRLDASLAQMKSVLLKNPRNKNRSFEWISKTMDVLMDDLKFPKEKIKKHTYLIQCDPKRLTEIITTLPTLGGKPILEMAISRPKILMSTAATLSEIDRLFQEAGIGHAAIAKYPEIYTLSSKTIKSRLEELDKIPQFTTFKSHPRVGRVIYYQNKVKSRIQHLESMDVHGVSLHILSTDSQRFAKFIKNGDMVNKGADIIHFVSSYLGGEIDRAQVRQNLLVHPNWLQVPVVGVKTALHFLRVEKGFQVSQIIKGLPLVLYPVERITEAMAKVEVSGEAEETDDFYLQMVLYFLESPGHFSGDGVFSKRMSRDELEDSMEIDDTDGNLHATSQSNECSGYVEQGQVELVEDESDQHIADEETIYDELGAPELVDTKYLGLGRV